MSDNSKIEWTDATWSPVTGCTKVSPGCEHCYIERTPPFRMAGRRFDRPGIGGTTGVQLHEDRLEQPMRWRKPRRIFVCSMADLFHASVPDEFIAKVWAVMAASPQHTFQVLTKRHARMQSLLSSNQFDLAVADAWTEMGTRAGSLDDDHTPPYPLPNVWLGVSTETQQWADIRIPDLLDTPAAVRWVSAEPMLGPLDLDLPRCESHGREYTDPTDAWCVECQADGWSGEMSFGHWLDPLNGGISWVVVGGESGPCARPMHPQWSRDLRDQCQTAGVPFHHKQWGEWAELSDDAEVWGSDMAVGMDGSHARVDQSGYPSALPDAAVMRHVGKKAAGRVLDGRTWDEYPK